MHTSRLAFNPALDTRRLAILIGAGILAVAAATAGRTYMDVQSNAADRVVELSAAFKAAPDLATLKGNSDLVIVGRIASQGTTRLVTQSGNSGITAPAPAALNLDPKKADAQKLQPAAPGVTPGKPIGNANIGTPVTTYSVQIERAVKGKGPTQISLTQLGGKVTLDTYPGGPKLQRTVEFEGDTLMQP